MSICLSTLVLRKWNGFCLSRGAISSHEWPKVTSGWKWHRVRGKNHWIVLTNQCTVGNQMLLALWGSRSEILKISFWSSLVIPRSQKTITKWISWLSFFSVYWAQNKKPGRKLAHFEEFPCLTKTTITPARVDGFACLEFVCLPTFRDYHFGPI